MPSATKVAPSPDPALHIRSARPTDVPLLLTLIRELANYERLTHEVVATEELLHEHLFGPASRAEALIAEQAGHPAGFALFFHNFSTFLARPGLYLEDLYVRPDLRGKGIGRALLQRLARIAADRNCVRMEWAVLNWNDPAIRFYQSLGAVPMTDWAVYRISDAPLARLAAL